MICVLVYGRNDDYASGLQKRAALSLNAFAAQLEPGADEILFVDDNTPDDRPSFPEAIADTLTERARALIRVLRVRPALHARIAGDGAAPVVEALARNVGLRRLRRDARWVLSTNTDVIALPSESGPGLRALVEAAADGFYGAPRFELPAMLWERLDRRDPAAAAERLRAWAAGLWLDEVVLHAHPAIGFDAPGDFQLALRADLEAVRGFDEGMRGPWHVDGNLCARLALLRGEGVAPLGGGLRIYHCEHSRLSSAKHAAGRPRADFARSVEQVSQPVPEGQGEDWGAPDAEVESIRLDAPDDAPAALLRAIGRPADPEAPRTLYGPAGFDATPRRVEHGASFVLDALIHAPRDARIGWLAPDARLAGLIAPALAAAGFRHAPMLSADDPEAMATTPRPDLLETADRLVLEFPAADGPQAQTEAAWDRLSAVILAEIARTAAGAPPREVLAVNAVNCRFETGVLDWFDCVLAPFSTRLRRGTLRAADPGSVLRALSAGPAGAWVDGGAAIVGAEGVAGHVFYGPYARLRPGAWRARLRLRLPGGAMRQPRLVLETACGDAILAQRDLSPREMVVGDVAIDFAAPATLTRGDAPGLEIRLWTGGEAAVRVEGAALERPA